jgi:thiamine biosynthesis lipoprotein
MNDASAPSDAYEHSVALMGTVVTVRVVGHGANDGERRERQDGVARAIAWFHQVEACCTRFDAASEVRQLSAQIGSPVRVSATLFEAVRFARAVAEESGGAFDPTVGQSMEERGFNREYRSGQVVRTRLEPHGDASYRDIHVDPDERTITLARPLVLDLGAVAKGLAIDLAARELHTFENFAVNAGGDLYLGGCNAGGVPWSVGIRHPRDEHQLIETLRVSDVAVCTSGDYERRTSSENGDMGHHILDPRTGESATAAASVTVLAHSAMVADALATAAFVLGPTEGMALLERHEVDGLIVTPSLARFATRGMRVASDHYRGREAAAARER